MQNALSNEERKFLSLLSRDYPTVVRAASEVISLEAQLKLPKGTEMYMSDIHGEDEAFSHILNNASGVIKEKIDAAIGETTDKERRDNIATLIYYPKLKLARIKRNEPDMEKWYRDTLYRLIDVCRHVCSKNTRAAVHKAIPREYKFVIDELLHAHFEDHNKEQYYHQIIEAIVTMGQADDFIEAISLVIKRLAVHKLHIIGDIFDRGSRADIIMDKLMTHHAVDIQWGNHDMLWMCGATGSPLGVASVIRICARYNNLDALEEGYGINLRPLAAFAEKTYTYNPCFKPKGNNTGSNDDEVSVAKIHKAISVIMYKLEIQVIERNPCFDMDDRKMLMNIDYDRGTIAVDGKEYRLRDTDFPTVDKDNPAKLTSEEIEVLQQLVQGFLHSEKLQAHTRFLYSHGSAYKIENGFLMYHGCIPLNSDGTMREVTLGGKTLKGKALMDHIDKMCRIRYFDEPDSIMKRVGQDILWYLWCGKNSPMFGRAKMATFENVYIGDKELSVEAEDNYYLHMEDSKAADAILEDFGLECERCRIINGHVPVKVSKGENPIKADGKIIVIDGGFSRAYHAKTGIAGYTMVYTSKGVYLRAHQPFTSVKDVVYKNSDIESKVEVFDMMKNRVLVESTDEGNVIREKIDDLKMLINAYRQGVIKQRRNDN